MGEQLRPRQARHRQRGIGPVVFSAQGARVIAAPLGRSSDGAWARRAPPEEFPPKSSARLGNWVRQRDFRSSAAVDSLRRDPSATSELRDALARARKLAQRPPRFGLIPPLPVFCPSLAHRGLPLRGYATSGSTGTTSIADGLPYIVSGSISPERTASWVSLGASYDADKAVRGVGYVLAAIRDLRAGKVSDDEVAAARETSLASLRTFYLSEDSIRVLFVRADRELDVRPLGLGPLTGLALPP